jgi:hypothetical protein
MSLTKVWEPKPMASPMTPAPAIIGPMLIPIDERMIMTPITSMNTNLTQNPIHQKIEGNHQQSLDGQTPAEFAQECITH